MKLPTLIALTAVLHSCGPTSSDGTLAADNVQSQALVFAKKIKCVDGSTSLVNPNIAVKPDAQLTPGALCSTPSRNRYPEKIAYCEREVEGSQKDSIFNTYKAANLLGETIRNRNEFKIDHLIPLCLGGGNDKANLWPQHKSVGLVTDPVEPRLCALLAQGKILQKEAVALIKKSKDNYLEAYGVCTDLSNRLGL